MDKSTQRRNSTLPLLFILGIGLYFVLHIVLRTMISPSLDYDEAEQAMLSQWLQIGYTEQPPLYTWIQYGLFSLFGKSVLAVSLLKNSLLFFTYLFVFLAGREIFKDNTRPALAAASLLFIPQICWESQRDMTHTTLVVCASAATLYIFLRLLRQQSTLNYIWLTIALATGILGKANFFLFFTVCILALLSAPAGRTVVINRKFLFSLLMAIVVSSPYLFWMYTHQDIVFSSSHKFKRGFEHYYLHGSWSLIENSFLFLTPFWFIFLSTFPAALKGNPEDSAVQSKFIGRYMLFFFMVLLLVVLLFKVTYVKDRWLQPLLFATPLFVFARVPESAITPRKQKIYLSIAITACLCIYVAFTLRFFAAQTIGDFSRLNYPFHSFAKSIKENGWKKGLIISDNRFLAGNLRLLFPDSVAIVPDYHFEDNGPLSGPALLVWRADHSYPPPEELKQFVIDTYGVNPDLIPPSYIEYPFMHGEKTVIMGTISLNIAERKR